MRLPLIPMPRTWHVGELDPALRGGQHAVSYEGAGLSVSNCPAAWRRIASLVGPTQRLVRPGALWVDLAALPGEARRAAVDHAVSGGLAEVRGLWRAWIWEDGRDAWHSKAFAAEAEAREFTVRHSDTLAWPRPDSLDGHLAALPPAAFPLPCDSLAELVPIPLLTASGNARAKGFGRGVDATDILVAFWSEDALRPAMPDVVGTWWRERHAPRHDLAPRGAAFATAVPEFAATRVRRDPAYAPEPDACWVSS